MTIPQLKMLKLFTQQIFTIEGALKLDQRVFGGLCAHGWVDYDVAFAITPDGEEAYELASRTHNFRKYNNGRFSVRAPKLRMSNVSVIKSKRRKVA